MRFMSQIYKNKQAQFSETTSWEIEGENPMRLFKGAACAILGLANAGAIAYPADA